MSKVIDPTLSIIACMDLCGALGKEGKIPWHVPEDLKHFKATTADSPCVMGRKTYQDMADNYFKGKKSVLPGRTVIVLSETMLAEDSYRYDNVVIARSINDVRNNLHTSTGHIFICGGARVYEDFLPYVDECIITELGMIVDGADTFFPVKEMLGRATGQELLYCGKSATGIPYKITKYNINNW